MKDVQLHRSHAVEIALDHLDGHPMPRDVQMQSAPGEARMVLNVDGRRFETLGCRFGALSRNDELSKCFEATQHAQRIRSGQERVLWRDLQVVALVFTELLDGLRRMVA